MKFCELRISRFYFNSKVVPHYEVSPSVAQPEVRSSLQSVLGSDPHTRETILTLRTGWTYSNLLK